MNVPAAQRLLRLAAVLPVAALCGCSLSTAPIIDPKRPIALAERDLLFDAFGFMLIVAIPVFVLVFWFGWRYRAANAKSRYDPDWSYSARLDAVIWLVPALIIVALGILSWHNTHELDPYKSLDPAVPPLKVEVVAQDWKWLFVYPEQGIAAVNQLVFPSGKPLSLRITSDTVMNSFFIPDLGGQIYAMAGMQTRLHLLAEEPGTFMGRNMQYSGDGFAKQYFEATATSQEDFDAWVRKARQSGRALDAAAYRALAKPTIEHPVTLYSDIEPNLFESIIEKYGHNLAEPGGMH